MSHELRIKNILYIDSSQREEVSVGIKINGKMLRKTKKSISFSSQVLLPLIDELFAENNFSLRELDEIEVNSGPGSFTGLRVGVSIANALSYALKIPVNGKKFTGTLLVVPAYS